MSWNVASFFPKIKKDILKHLCDFEFICLQETKITDDMVDEFSWISILMKDCIFVFISNKFVSGKSHKWIFFTMKYSINGTSGREYYCYTHYKQMEAWAEMLMGY